MEITRYDGYIAVFLERVGDSSDKTYLPLIDVVEGVATLHVTNEAKSLPFGLYELVVKSHSCECGRYRVMVQACETTRPATCSDKKTFPTMTTLDLPPRKCVESSNCDEPIDFQREPEPKCENKPDQKTGIELDWKITQRKDSNE